MIGNRSELPTPTAPPYKAIKPLQGGALAGQQIAVDLPGASSTGADHTGVASELLRLEASAIGVSKRL
jgi:hypothetical protein